MLIDQECDRGGMIIGNNICKDRAIRKDIMNSGEGEEVSMATTRGRSVKDEAEIE